VQKDFMTRSSVYHLVLLSALSIPIIFWNLGQNSLHNADEALYASVSQQILETNEWVTLHHQGKPWFVKAPLLFWLTAVAYKLFGVSEFAARFWSATFGVATVVALYLLAARIFNTRVAFLASLILLSCTQFIYYHGAKAGELDTALTFFMMSAMLLFVMAREEPKYFYAACFSIGLCVMSKHLTYLLPIATTLGLFVILTRSVKRFSWKVWSLGFGILLATALPWHLIEWIRHGDEFLRVYFFQEVYVPAVDWRRDPLGSWFYFVAIKDGLFPWSLLLPFSLVWAGSRQSRGQLSTNLLLVLWTAVLFAIITASVIKLSWYILPAYPALAILMAQFIDDFTRNRGSKYLDYCFLGGFAMVLMLTRTEDNPFAHMASHGMAQIQFLEPVRSLSASLGFAFPVLVVACLSLLIVLWTKLATRPAWTSVRSGLVLGFIAIALYQVILPLKFSDTKLPFHEACEKTVEIAGSSREHLIALPNWKKRLPTYAFYFENVCPTGLEVIQPGELVTQLDLLKPERVFLADRERLERFPPRRRLFEKSDTRVLYENEDYVVFEMSPEWNGRFRNPQP
jgi:4-amino-4-deoxy-L-arabinose transferase-like glycosyltransferase